jgi:hypothetical protein
MSKKTLSVICYLVLTGSVLVWGYIEGFSDQWMLWVLGIGGVLLLISYGASRVWRRRRVPGDTTAPRHQK